MFSVNVVELQTQEPVHLPSTASLFLLMPTAWKPTAGWERRAFPDPSALHSFTTTW